MKRTQWLRVVAALVILATFEASADEVVPTGLMDVRRYGHASTLLSDGTVLLTGGNSDTATRLYSAEIYDPSTRTFTFAYGSTHTPRINHRAILLHDGTVLVVGGSDIFDDPPAPAEIYDPATQLFTQVGRPVQERYQFMAFVLPSGKVVLAGGSGCCRYSSNGSRFSTALNSVEMYDPETRSFSALSPLSDYRGLAASAQLSNGGILVAGGSHLLYDGDELLGVEYLSTADVLDPSTLTFSPTFGGMSVARSGWDAALLPNGKILVPYGGVLPDGTALSPSSDVYDPANDTFAAGPSPTFDRTHEPSVTLPDGRVVFVGGRDVAIDARTNTIDIYDPSQNTFTTSTATMSIARWMHQATALRDGSVLITGGLGMNNIPLIGGELFVPSPSVVDRLFSDGFEVSRLAEAGSAAAAASPITLSTACAEAHRPAPDQARRGIVEVWQLADGTECEWP